MVWNTSSHSEDKLPINLLIGISYLERLNWFNSTITLSISRDNNYHFSNHWGSEISFNNLFSIRMGLQDKDITAGAGIKVFKFQLNYAFVSYDLGNSHRISGTIMF